MASAEALRYKVLLGLRGMSAHIRDVSYAERILGSSCAKPKEAPQTVIRDDLWEYFVVAWCVYPRFIPHEKIVTIPEPDVLFVVEHSIYIGEHEAIRSGLLALQ
jgi:hypothetical protein